MKKSLLLRMTPVLLGGVGLKTFVILAMMLGIGCGSAMASEIGAKDAGWTASGSYTTGEVLSAGMMRTLTFTVDELGSDWWASYVVDITKANVPVENNEDTYLFLRSCLFDYHVGTRAWNDGAIYNSHTFGETTINDVISGATVVLNIRRFSTYVIITSDITTASSVKYYNHYVQDLGTTDDVYVFLCGDEAKLTISSDVTAITSLEDSVEVLVGAEDNTNGWASTYIRPLEPNGIINLQFKNCTNGSSANVYDNATVQFNYWDSTANDNKGADQWFNLTLSDLLPWGEISDDAASKSVVRSKWPTTDDDLKAKFNNADVTLTIARYESTVTFTAVITPESGEPFSCKYTLVANASYPDFATSNIYIRLVGRNSHMYAYFPYQKVNAEVSQYGWSTFSSDCKLDFSGISGLEAYAVKGHNGIAITKSDALGVVAANTGVLLKGTKGDTPTFFNIPVSTGSAYSGDNLLVAGTGASVSAEAGKTRYVLGVNGSAAEFQKIISTPATVAKGKAYLQFNEEIAARALSFEDESTGVMAIDKVQPAVDNVYDLSGRKIVNGKSVNGKLQRGLYIVNGKKVVVK